MPQANSRLQACALALQLAHKRHRDALAKAAYAEQLDCDAQLALTALGHRLEALSAERMATLAAMREPQQVFSRSQQTRTELMRTARQQLETAQRKSHAAWLRSWHGDVKRHNAEARMLRKQLAELEAEAKRENAPVAALQRELALADAEVATIRTACDDARIDLRELRRHAAHLEHLCAEARRELKRAQWQLLRQAGVPIDYMSSASITVRLDGSIGVYFGDDLKDPEQPHAHYAFLPNGTLNYRREIDDPRGAHNYLPTDSEADAA